MYIYIYTHSHECPLFHPGTRLVLVGHGESLVCLLPLGGFLSSRWGDAGGGGQWPWLSDAEPLGAMAGASGAQFLEGPKIDHLFF